VTARKSKKSPAKRAPAKKKRAKKARAAKSSARARKKVVARKKAAPQKAKAARKPAKKKAVAKKSVARKTPKRKVARAKPSRVVKKRAAIARPASPARRAAGTQPVVRALVRTPAQTAQAILANPRIALVTVHPSGVVDDAHARQNLVDAAAGRPARRSAYGNAPGGTVVLGTRLLEGILALAADFTFRVSEIAGGSHSTGSRHYAGVSFDADRLNGLTVHAGNSHVARFRASLQRLGATEVLGPGDPGHATHVHGAWPRA
jgi:hypothetical protein